MPQPLWTVRKIADELGIPESTVRYYRDQFDRFVPSVGRARRRRYPEEAVAVLRFIADAYAAGQRREDIEATLAETRGELPDAAERVNPLPILATPAVARAVDQLLAGEAQRQEALWQLAQQVARIGEALEHQQATLQGIVARIENGARALPPPPLVERRAQPPAPVPEDMEALRKELDTERELVDRLRRAKLDLERQLVQSRKVVDGPGDRSGVIARLLRRDRPGP